jgi:hypothetical protein
MFCQAPAALDALLTMLPAASVAALAGALAAVLAARLTDCTTSFSLLPYSAMG